MLTMQPKKKHGREVDDGRDERDGQDHSADETVQDEAAAAAFEDSEPLTPKQELSSDLAAANDRLLRLQAEMQNLGNRQH
jgi:molecular chaperone GrpE (heat shock protein)